MIDVFADIGNEHISIWFVFHYYCEVFSER